MADTLQPASPTALAAEETNPRELDPRRFRALAVIGIAQLMIVLDASVVTIALPHAQAALHISNANRQWALTAYTLAFGGLLLIGGRIADYLGRKRVFILSLLGFAAASALGGLAQDAAMLFGARALQGAFAALMAPSSLSLLTVTFTEARERARAFGVYGAIAGGGAAIGLVLGGALTQYASWRWTLLINVPIGIIAAVFAKREITESKADGARHYDVPGAVLVTGALVSLVYGFTRAEIDGWGSPVTISLLMAAVVLLGAFIVRERSTANPLLPLRVVLDRNRGGSFLASLLVGMSLFGMFLFLTYYMQGILGYSALRTGIAFLPFSAGIIFSAGMASQLLPRFGPRVLMTVGLSAAAVAMVWFAQIGVHTSYVSHVLPAEIVMSVGLGFAFVPFSSTALIGVAPHDAGVASALINATQQIGGSMGTALLNTIANSATSSYMVAHHQSSAFHDLGLVHGYTTGFLFGVVVLVIAVVGAAGLIKASRKDLPTGDAVTAMA
jgi:EmrB/QacA subfamily drug resistance transporter